MVKAEAEGKGKEAKSTKGEVNPKDPPPGGFLGEGAADYWA